MCCLCCKARFDCSMGCGECRGVCANMKPIAFPDDIDNKKAMVISFHI